MIKDKYTKIGINTKSKIFKNWFNSGLLNDVDEAFALDVENFWMGNYNTKIDPILNMAFMNLTGLNNSRLIPSRIIHKEIFPVFNDYNVTNFYGDKNFYDTIIKPPHAAETVVRNIRGTFFDSEYNIINFENAHKLLLSSNRDLVIKPSKSNNGEGVKKLSIRDNKVYFDEESVTFDHLLEIYKKDFIIQKMIQQHPNMAAPHPASVNTIRMVTFRWKGEVRYLLAFARFGANNDIRDNANVDISPRLGITDSGDFFNVGLSQSGQQFTHHPTTGFRFADLDPIPNYEEFKQFVKDKHKHFLHLDIISWDIAVGLDGKPVFIETNFSGSTSFYQLVTQRSFFGDLTEEVLQYVSSELKTNEPLLQVKHRKKVEEKKERVRQKRVKVRQKRIKKLKKQNQFLEQQLENQERKFEKKLENQERKFEEKLENQDRELRETDKKYIDMLNSNSFRYTRPLRKISKLLK